MNTAGLGKVVLNMLVNAIAGRAVEILRAELADAKLEIEGKAKQLATGMVLTLIAICMFGLAFALLVVSGTIALAEVWPAWMAPLVVGGGLLVIGGIMVAVGVSKVKNNRDLRPQRAMTNLKRYMGK